MLVELPIHHAPQSVRNTRDMILHRAQITFDTETQLIEEMLDSLASSGLPWLSPSDSYMDIEPGINDFELQELESLASLSRNAKSVLAGTLTKRLRKSEAWNSAQFTRQLQIVIRILSVVQEFRRLSDVILLLLQSTAQLEAIPALIVALTTWHAPFEGMGVLPQLIDALALCVFPVISRLIIVEKDLPRSQTKYIYCSRLDSPTCSTWVIQRCA